MTLEETVRRNLRRHGEQATLYTYTQTGTDDYGDPTFSETTVTTTAIFRQATGDVREVQTAAGTTTMPDNRIFVSNEFVGELKHASENTVRASEVLRERTGERFRVVDTWDENNGQMRILAVKISD